MHKQESLRFIFAYLRCRAVLLPADSAGGRMPTQGSLFDLGHEEFGAQLDTRQALAIGARALGRAVSMALHSE